MPTIIFVDHAGKRRLVEAQSGNTLMRVAIENDVPGILADCGGTCACGTCRVYIDPAWLSKTGDLADSEDAMLDMHNDSTPGKRLSCQITVTDDMDGIIVTMPESQF